MNFREKICKLAALGVIVVIGNLSCVHSLYENERESMDLERITDVLKRHNEELLSLPGVAGTAIGLCEDKYCITVFIEKRTPELDRQIPDAIESYTVVIKETGGFEAL